MGEKEKEAGAPVVAAEDCWRRISGYAIMKSLNVSKYTSGVLAHNQKLRLALVVFVPLMLMIRLGLGLFFGLNHKPNRSNNPKLPIFQIQSLPPPPHPNSSPGTWNITVSVANPNPPKHLTLFIDNLALELFYYPSNSKNDTDRVSVMNSVKLIPPPHNVGDSAPENHLVVACVCGFLQTDVRGAHRQVH